MKDKRFELSALNLDGLDIQDLEARLKLTVSSPLAAEPGACPRACVNKHDCYNGCVSQCEPPAAS